MSKKVWLYVTLKIRINKIRKEKTSYQIGIINNKHVHTIKLQAVTETQCNEWTVSQLPLYQNLKTTTQSRNNKQFVKIVINDATNATFIYLSTNVHVSTLFSM